MPIIKFIDWRPDVSDYEGQTSLTISGVLPRGDGYGPMRASAAYSTAMAGQCRGGFAAYNNDGTPRIFSATTTNLYEMNNSTLGWTARSGALSAISADQQWQFTQFGKFVIAVQGN